MIERKKKPYWQIIKILSNLQLSISMLLIIAGISILGTIIEQDKTIEFYKINYPINENSMNFFSWKFIKILGLDHIFQTWWFISLLIFFSSSLIICTLSRQLPILKISRNLKIYKKFNLINQSKIYKDIKKNILSNYIISLNKKNYSVFQSKNQIYAYKGILGRLAPIIVHVSMLFILTGASIGFLNGFVAQEMVPRGEFFHIQNLIGSGAFSKIPQNLIYKLNDFWIDYNVDNSVNQFYSNITIYDNKMNIKAHNIVKVNQPLKYEDIVIYQTDWNITGLRLNLNNQTLQIPLKSIITNSKEKIWIGSIPISTQITSRINFVINTLDNRIYLYNDNQELIRVLNKNETFNLGNKKIRIMEILTSSGLQIKRDPGIPIVYLGFLALMISSLISYISFNQIWLSKEKNLILSTGDTNRSVLEFENDFVELIKTAILIKSPSQI
uniref:Cytochrome c biogenesis protein Ccs1 n=1 Tax=Flintiella sanguinaria TaxID=101926 RepID=A0A1X9PUB0_9RHOD|nr:cytochrome c biogenesis protein [Flintiella sanguinaria]